MNGKLLVDALTDKNSEPLHLEIEYALPDLCVFWQISMFSCFDIYFFPPLFNYSVEEIVNPNGGSNYTTQYRNLDKLVKRLDLEILSKLDGSSKASTSNPAR